MLKVMPSQTIAREVQIAAGFAEDSQIPLPEISFADRYLEAVSLGTRAEVYPQGVLDDFRQWLQQASDEFINQKIPSCRKAYWPGGAPFAVFLSTDVDQIHDRELFRWLGDVNHLRRHLFRGEQGKIWPCIRRIIRPAFKPIDPICQFRSLRRIQAAHGWKSTFYLLEDKKWARLGGRFNWDDPEFERISQFLLADGCELGIHGSAYSHAELDWWTQKRQRFERLYSIPALGARNHYLSLSVPETWLAQQRSGMMYDATLGYPNRLGTPGDFCFPIRVSCETGYDFDCLIELPLTIMDVTLFRYLGMEKEQAFEASVEAISQVRDVGGLVSILWHNNFFSEEEYIDWEETYARILDWLAPQSPWVARGVDIATWWRSRNQVKLTRLNGHSDGNCWSLSSAESIENLVIEVDGLDSDDEIDCGNAIKQMQRIRDCVKLLVPSLRAEDRLRFSVHKKQSL